MFIIKICVTEADFISSDYYRFKKNGYGNTI